MKNIIDISAAMDIVTNCAVARVLVTGRADATIVAAIGAMAWVIEDCSHYAQAFQDLLDGLVEANG